MKAIMLGSGGVIPPPRIGCNCNICKEARDKGIPYSRTGPSFFLPDENLLFDCPEEIRIQLNREKIINIKNVILTHWHPDHTLGLRMLEQLNWDFVNKKPVSNPIKVYISKFQMDMFKKLSCGSFLEFYEKKGFIKIIYFDSHDMLEFGKIKVQPIIIDYTKGFYFVISDGKKKIVYAPCEYHKLKVDKTTKNVDVFISHNLFWEDKSISPRKIPPTGEDSFEEMLVHAKEMNAKKIIITHIEETFKLGHDELNEVFKDKYPNLNIEAGYDGMKIEL